MRRLRLCRLLPVFVLAYSLPVQAQQPGKVYRIGYLSGRGPFSEAFEQGMRDHGYEIGKNLLIEYRTSVGNFDQLPALAAELVRLNVDVIVAGINPHIIAAMQATSTIPIVMTFSNDPVGAGLVASLARPGGNLTGLSLDTGDEFLGKRLELLKDAVPKLTRVAVLGDRDQRNYAVQMADIEAAAQSLGLKLQPLRVQKADDLEKAFSAMTKANLRAFSVLVNPAFGVLRDKIVELARKNRLPGMYSTQDYVNAGGLMTYAPDRIAIARRQAVYVDKILKGTKTTDLPVERPMKFEFVINLKTAKQIGVTIPPNVLARADRVIREASAKAGGR